MDTALLTLLALLLGAMAWIDALATHAILNDPTLTRFQLGAQLLIVWLTPFLGALLVLRLAHEYNPDHLPSRFIPWPLRRAIGAPPRRPSSLRADDRVAGNIDPFPEIPGQHRHRRDSNADHGGFERGDNGFGDGGGGDSGGDT